MTDDLRFDELLQEDAAALPPPSDGAVNPWQMAMGQILWGMGLTTITLNILYLDYILPALGAVLLVLGFRTLRRENKPLGWCYKLALAALILRGVIYVLLALPVELGNTLAYCTALVTLALILILTLGADVHPAELPGYNLIQIIPYVLVLIGGIAGINVFVVLLVGIVSGSIIMLAVRNEGEVVAEHRSAHNGRDAQREAIPRSGGYRQRDRDDERDGADGGAHRGGHKAAYHEQHRHGILRRDDRQQKIRDALRTAAADDADKYSGGHEYEYHGDDVLVADALAHKLKLFVEAQGAVLQAVLRPSTFRDVSMAECG